MTQELNEVDQIKQSIAELQAQLLEQHPQLPSRLRDIHSRLLKEPQLVQVLTEEEIAVIVQGLMKQTQIQITTPAAKKSSAITKKRVANMSVDEL